MDQARKLYPEAATAEGWQAVLARFGLTEKDLVAHVQEQIDMMRLVDAHLRPAIQIDSKTVEAYYREKFIPQLKQSIVEDTPSAEDLCQDPRIVDPGKSQRVDGFLVADSALGKQSDFSGYCSRNCRGGSADAVTEPAPRPRRRWKYLLIAAGTFIFLLLAGLWYTTTGSFQAYVRRRMIAELERITGGRAEIGSFHVVPFHLQVEVRNLTVHGSETSTDVPWFTLTAWLRKSKLISFLRTEFGFHSLILDHPVIHVVVGADGPTNRPRPAGSAAACAEHSIRIAVCALY